MSFLQGQSVVQRICVLKKHLIYRDFQERFENRFPLRASLKGEAKSSKKPYVSMICKVFSFFSDVFESIKKQVARTEIVTCFARTENRSRITHNALSCIVLRRNISMLHTFNLFKPMQPCAERHFPWFSSAKRPKFPRRAKHPSMPVSPLRASRPKSTPAVKSSRSAGTSGSNVRFTKTR